MASARRTFDTDSITLRTVFAKNGNNTNIPALKVLTADGSGGTLWKMPSSFGTNPSFNQIATTAGTFTADLSYNTFTMTSGEGIGMTAGAAGTNQLYLFAKAFNQIDVSGANSLYAYSNATLTPSLQIAGAGGVQLRSDPARNILYVDGPLTTTVSSGQYAFNRFLIVPTVSTINTNIPTTNGTILAANSPSSLLTFSGVGDVILSSVYSTNQVFFTVSSYTAAGFLAISGEAFGTNTNVLSTISSLYVTKTDFSTATTIVSTNTFSNTSSVLSTLNGVSSFFGVQFNTLSNLISLRATIVQLDTAVDNFTTAISSFSTNYIDYTAYLSSAAGIPNQISSVVTISNVSTMYIWGGNFFNFSVGNIVYDQSDISTLSTSAGRSISTTSNFFTLQNQGNLLSTFSTTLGLGTLGYISSPQLFSTNTGLGSLGYVSTASLTSSLSGVGTMGYISSAQLLSTTAGLGTAGYFSTPTLASTFQSTTLGVFNSLGSYGYISSLSLASTLQSTTQGIFNYMGSSNYISTASLTSTLQSTVQGIGNSLGSQQYVSIATLNTALASTVEGLGTVTYISSATLNYGLVSTFSRVGVYGFISTPNVQSTMNGLGTINYVSTSSLVSTTSSLVNFLSTGLGFPSFKSSLVYGGNSGIITGAAVEVSPGSSIGLYFSSVSFSLDSFSSFIQPNTSIFVDVNENFYFSSGDTGDFGKMSTNLKVGETSLLQTMFVDSVPYYFINNNCNSYARTITFEIPRNDVLTSYTSTFHVEHYIPNGINDPTYNPYQGFTSQNIYIANSQSNSIFATILN